MISSYDNCNKNVTMVGIYEIFIFWAYESFNLPQRIFSIASYNSLPRPFSSSNTLASKMRLFILQNLHFYLQYFHIHLIQMIKSLASGNSMVLTSEISPKAPDFSAMEMYFSYTLKIYSEFFFMNFITFLYKRKLILG